MSIIVKRPNNDLALRFFQSPSVIGEMFIELA
jgi:hypothetical protein